jgi:diaminopimelate decarboxylase
MRLGEHLDADDRLSIRDGELYLEECSLAGLARRFGTPLNVVSQDRLQRRAREFVREFGAAWSDGPVQVLPSLKANFSLALRRLLTLEGLGCDTFGSGELQAALACRVPPALISVNGSSKSPQLMRHAILAGAHLTLDSLREVRLAVAIAEEAQTTATIRVRLRPDYASLTALSEFAAEPHTIADVAARYKPGVPREDLPEAARLLCGSDWVEVVGCHAHVGRHQPYLAMWEAVIPCFVREIAAFAAAMGGEWRPRVIDIGGGFSPRRDPVGLSHAPAGDASTTGEPRRVPPVADYARCITACLRRELQQAGLPTSDVTLQLEPGRSLYANAGLQLATVVNLKGERQGAHGAQGAGTDRVQLWVETDTSEAFLPDVNLEGVRWTVVPVAQPEAEARITADVVGISCGFDVLLRDALLPALVPGDLLAFLDAGAYQDSGSNNFNAMPRPATVLVHGSDAEVIKRAETQADVFRRDVVPARLGPVTGLGSGAASDEAPGDDQEA